MDEDENERERSSLDRQLGVAVLELAGAGGDTRCEHAMNGRWRGSETECARKGEARGVTVELWPVRDACDL